MASFSAFSRGGNSTFSNASETTPGVPQDVEVIEIDDDDDDEQMNDVQGTEEEEETSAEEYDEEYEDEDGMQIGQEISDDDDEEEEEEEEEDDESESNGLNGSATNGTHELETGDARPGTISFQSGLVSPSLFNSDVKETLHPLQDTAERVAKQIESFAQSLDSFRRKSPAPQDTKSFHEVCELVKTYRNIAQTNAKELSKPAATRRSNRLSSGAGRESLKQNVTAKDEEQIKHWHLEAETWDLIYQLLSVADPESCLRMQRSQATVFQSLHRYSSDREVWEGFLATDHFALESVIVLRWLEKSSTSSAQLDVLISELEKEADRGQGLWAHGWLYTKEAIKGAKRLRSWPQPLEPEDSGITASLLSSEKREPLITQLDPDAVTRQRLGLQKQDQFYEQATWLTFWKMLRSGKNWTHIRQWSHERLESWRANSVCGASTDSTGNTAHGPADDSLVRMMNFRSQETWRSACSTLANDARTDPYERAVYALLAGETEPAYAVCQGWSDYLYVYYNHIIVTRYRSFCKQLQRKLSYSPEAEVAANIEPPAYDGVLNLLDNLKKDGRISAEAKNPYRTIQAAVLSKGYDNFFYHQAHAALKAAAISKKPTLIPKSSAATNVDDSSLIVATDEPSLRIVTHLFLLQRALGLIRSDSHYVEAAAMNVVRYIDFLRDSERTKLIPVYVSMLPEKMGNMVLGKVLNDVTDHEERQDHVKRMNSLGIDAAAVLRSQWQWALSGAGEATRKTLPGGRVHDPEELPTIPRIRAGILDSYISPQVERLIRSLEWYRYVEGQWPVLCAHACYLYKRFISAGGLGLARELLKRIHFSGIPMEAEATQSETLDARRDATHNGVGNAGSPKKNARSKSPVKMGQHRRQRSSVSQSGSSLEHLYMQAQTIRDLELLVGTFDMLEQWGNIFEEYEKLSDPAAKREPKHQLQECLDEITEHIEPLCDDWLTQPTDENEASELEFIRTTYLPEAIIAYHSALYFAGHNLGREVLAQCMTLATAVAGSPTLIECFQASNRMKELVNYLALSSVALLSLKESKLKKKLPQGASLDIWKFKPIEEEAADFTLYRSVAAQRGWSSS